MKRSTKQPKRKTSKPVVMCAKHPRRKAKHWRHTGVNFSKECTDDLNKRVKYDKKMAKHEKSQYTLFGNLIIGRKFAKKYAAYHGESRISFSGTVMPIPGEIQKERERRFNSPFNAIKRTLEYRRNNVHAYDLQPF